MMRMPPGFMAASRRGKAFCNTVEKRLASTTSACCPGFGLHSNTSAWKSSRFSAPPLRSILRAATSTAIGSKSKLTALAAPSRKPARASTPVPQPISARFQLPGARLRTWSQSMRRHVEVVAWLPVPKARSAGNVRMMRWGYFSRSPASTSGADEAEMTSLSRMMSGGVFSGAVSFSLQYISFLIFWFHRQQ